MDENERKLRQELVNAETALNSSQSARSGDSVVSETKVETGLDTQTTKSTLLEKLENKKKELVCYSSFSKSFKFSPC